MNVPDNERGRPEMPTQTRDAGPPPGTGTRVTRDEPAQDSPRADLSATERFERFHHLNPEFYAVLVRLTRRYIARTGRQSLGMQRVIEVARWDMEVDTARVDEFRVNNDLAAYYSRLIMAQERDLAGVFQTRRAPEADEWAATLGGAA